ncbi:MAG: NADH:quinone oxidoreductase, partial [Yoonia sp.]
PAAAKAAKPAAAKAAKPAAAKAAKPAVAKAAKPAAAKAAKPAVAKAAKPAVAKAAKPAAAKAPKAPKAAPAKPAVLAKARAGGADDLKMIKGVGPVLEKALNASGVFHFDQVAVWKKADAVWFDENVKGANGRVVRDEWVKQAKILAKGGTTEFASKVKKGGVY